MPSPPGTMVNMILNRIVQSFEEPKNRERIQSQFIDPLLNYILNRMFPYIILISIIFSVILLMSLVSVALLVLQLPMVSSVSSSMAMASPMPMPIIPNEQASVAISALAESVINTTP
jgi:hypothetical protein